MIAPTLSLPVLGFYGSWTEASMFDVADNADPEELRAPYLGAYNANAVGLVYGDKPYSAYYFGGNPVTPDAVYHPERNATTLSAATTSTAGSSRPSATRRLCVQRRSTPRPARR